MQRMLKKRSRKAGLPPGTAVHIGDRKRETMLLRVMHYDTTHVAEHDLTRVDDYGPLRRRGGVSWLHVVGVHDVQFLDALGRFFDLHPLVLEDIANTDQRPKLEEYSGYVFLVLKTLQNGANERETAAAQVSLVLGPDFVLSFEEAEPKIFEAVRARIRDNRGNIRTQGADYLAYSLIDAVVDNYFLVLEHFGERIERLQEGLLGRASRRSEETLHGLRHEMVLLRKSVWPLREVIGSLERGASAQFRRETWVYLRDVYDHVIHMIDTLESFHEILTYMLDLHLLNATNRLNEVIKVLTVIATVMLPPTLIASIYGMNFKFMPELGWWWGYPVALGLMAVTAAAMLGYFRRKRWI